MSFWKTGLTIPGEKYMIWGNDTIQGSYDWDILKNFLYRTWR